MGETAHAIDYAQPDVIARWRPSVASTCMFVAAGVLTLISAFHVSQYWHEEPFMTGLGKGNAVFYVGIGTTLLVGWSIWTVAAITLIVGQRLHWAWVVVLPWGGVNVYYLHEATDAYMQDVISYEQGLEVEAMSPR